MSALLGASCTLVGACSSCGPGSSAGTPGVAAGPSGSAQPFSPFIVVDQFGYRVADEKIAVLRTPVTGFDKGSSYTPAAKVAIVDAHSGSKVLEVAPTAWNGGATDDSSGDKAWWVDFSAVTAVGDYFVLDETANARSDVFHISDDAYRDVLTQSVRMFYYQRDGIAKEAKYAGADWADGMAHPQDAHCHLFSDASGPRDLHGGWFDAGDQNRYTNFAATAVIALLRAYVENPTAFGDATNIPESGNGVPDLLDEVKWEIDWLVRMQNADASVLSVAGHQGASPPSTDKSLCKYGPVNTSGTLSTAAAFAFASKVYGSVASVGTAYPGFAADLGARSKSAWTWASAHPNVIFYNTGAVASGEQEVDDSARVRRKVQAAVFLFELTGDTTYQSFVDANYSSVLSSFDPYHTEDLDTALEYARKRAAPLPSVTSAILTAFRSAGWKARTTSACSPAIPIRTSRRFTPTSGAATRPRRARETCSPTW